MVSLFDKLFGSNTLYYPGCLTKFVALDLLENYRAILRKLSIDFIELKELEVCCGSPVLKAGYIDDFKDLAENNLKVFKEHSVGKIITNCPACAAVFKKEYPRVLGERWGIEVEHITQTITRAEAFRNWKLEIGNSSQGRVVYHDPCHLGRLLGIYDAPREIIKSLGYELVELPFSRENSFCCGGGGGVRVSNPALAEKIGKERLEQIKEVGADILATACPMCRSQLRGCADKVKMAGLEVKDISELII